MKTTPPRKEPSTRWRKALAENLALVVDIEARIASLRDDAQKQRTGHEPQGDSQPIEADRAAGRAGLEQMLASAAAKRDDSIAAMMAEEELPRRIDAYQELVLRVNAAWNDILAYDDTMRRRFPGRRSVFNTAGPHERVVLAPSTDNSPVPAIAIDPRKLFAAAGDATDRFVEALASDAEVRFRRS